MNKGWETKELVAVSAINYGYTDSASSEPVGPRFLRITDIQDDGVDWGSVPYCKIEPADLPKYRLASGDIVFARTGATTGKSFLVEDPPEAVFASYLIRLRLLDKKLLPEFVSLFFQTAGYWQSIKDGSSGSAQGGFNATKLGALEIPVPPLPEQQRIVGILEKAFEGVDSAKANAEKNLQNACVLVDSHLQSVFTQRGKGWAEYTLGDFCVFENGDRGTNYPSRSARTATGIPFINAGHLTDSGIDLETMDYISRERFDLLTNGKIRKGDILFCLRGSLGKFASVGNLDEGAIASSLVIVRPDKTVLDEYLAAYFRSSLCADMINRFKNGAAQPNLSAQSLRKFIVPVPPLSEQQVVVEQLASLRDETQRLEAIYEQKLAALEALRKSLLHQAFSRLSIEAITILRASYSASLALPGARCCERSLGPGAVVRVTLC
jgi:type I restriction enzyme S subunit